MAPVPVIAIFDIGKTNKKFLLFDESYQVVYEQSEKLPETVDDEGGACEDIIALKNFVYTAFDKALSLPDYRIIALNFSAYGASFVYLNKELEPVAPLYNYLKPFPNSLELDLVSKYGSKENISLETASPWLGNLNSGFQVYRVKCLKPAVFGQTSFALHLPQYISSLFTRQPVSEITSIGCHTALWDFVKADYHQWVKEEGLLAKFPPIISSDTSIKFQYKGQTLQAGVGLHDSSAALIPYLVNFEEPFVLISTGTWCISLNPFNHQPLTIEELEKDCLCYLSFKGQPVKASRLFAGNDHEQQVKELANFFKKDTDYYKKVRFDELIFSKLRMANLGDFQIGNYTDYETAYHALVWDIVNRQKQSTDLVLKGTDTKRIFVDGGFSQNELYMNMLSSVMKGIEVYAASMPQASSLGAAMAIHKDWNKHPLPKNLIELKYYSDRKDSINL